MTTRMNTHRTRRAGFTLIEILMALAITGLLMAALGAATHTCLNTYRQNEHLASASQMARSVLHRMTSEIRTAAAIQATQTKLTILPPDNSQAIIEYAYENGTLWRSTQLDGVKQTHEVISQNVGLESFKIEHTMGLDWQDRSCVTQVTVEMLIKQGKYRLPLRTCTSPRRNQVY